MDIFIPGLIVGFREGLEAFLIIVIMLQYLNHIQQSSYKKNVYLGTGLGILSSLGLGAVLYFVSIQFNTTEEVTQIWESLTSFIALILITSFIIWMIKHGKSMVLDVQAQVQSHLSRRGLFSIAFMMVVREGVEIAVFTFAGSYTLSSILWGIVLALGVVLLIYKSLIHINLSLIFNVTLIYLILQAGYLLGFGVHEGLSTLKDFGILLKDSPWLIKAYNLQNTMLDHKTGIIGIPLYVLVGWNSRPERLQFVMQTVYTVWMFMFLRSTNRQS